MFGFSILLAISMNGNRGDNDSLSAHKGADPEEIEGLLMTAFELRAKVVGIRYVTCHCLSVFALFFLGMTLWYVPASGGQYHNHF